MEAMGGAPADRGESVEPEDLPRPGHGHPILREEEQQDGL